MQSNGEWALTDDGVLRPVLHGGAMSADGHWVTVPFLVDTGADRTVFSAADLRSLGLLPFQLQGGLRGVGGLADSVVVDTSIRLFRETGDDVTFHGQFAAFSELEALDISVFGRDILGLFAVIVDRPGDVVCLVGQRHRYQIVEG